MKLTKKLATMFVVLATALLTFSCNEPAEDTPTDPNEGKTEIEDGTIVLDSFHIGYYFGNFWDDGIGGYYFILTNDSKLGYNAAYQEVPMTPGCWLLCVELWGDLSADSTSAIIPEGTYNYAERHGESNIFTSEYTVATYNAEQVGELFRIQNTFFKDGTITIEHTDKGYKMVANFVTEKDEEMKFYYEGAITFEDQSDDEPFNPGLEGDVTINPISATYYTYETTEEYSNVVLNLFTTDNLTYDNMHPNEPGMALHLDFYTEPNAGLAGTYTPGEISDYGILLNKEPGIFYPGKLYAQMALGSHIEVVNNDEEMSVEYGVLVDGEFTITDNGDGTHTIKGTFTTAKDSTVTCDWTGVINPHIGA